MRILKIILALALCGASLLWISCTLKSESASESKTQVAAVQRGDLAIDITASGNLALAKTEDLAFQMAGHVSQVMVEEGDSVKAGQVVAKLSTEEWDDHLTALENQLIAKQRALTAKQRALTAAQRQVVAKERALSQANLSLQTAEYNLYVIEDVQKANDKVTDAENRLLIAQMQLPWANTGTSSAVGLDPNYVKDLMAALQKGVADAKRELNDILKDHSTTITPDVATQVRLKSLQVELARASVDDAQAAIEDAQEAIEDAQEAIEDAQEAVRVAQKALDDAKKISALVTATFDGFVSKVNVLGGDEIFKGRVAVQIADPNKFEAEILVSEKDIPSVKVDGQASVGIDAMPGVSLPAKVTWIAPTATIQSGVVNYRVKVELDSSQPVPQAQSGQAQRSRPTAGSGMAGGGQVSSGATPQSIQLRQGLSVTVTILVGQRNNVVLVPNRAIIRQGRDTTVQVMKDGVVSSRTIKIGINNWQYTEVTEGLSEGEEVVLQQVTAATPTRQLGGQGASPPIMLPRR